MKKWGVTWGLKRDYKGRREHDKDGEEEEDKISENRKKKRESTP